MKREELPAATLVALAWSTLTRPIAIQHFADTESRLGLYYE